MKNKKLFIILLFYAFSYNLFGNNKFESTKRAYTEIISFSDKDLIGTINYFDFWNDDVNQSALYLFFKGKDQTLEIDAIELEDNFFSVEISDDDKGFYLLSSKGNKSQNCIDFRITFKYKISNISSHLFPYWLASLEDRQDVYEKENPCQEHPTRKSEFASQTKSPKKLRIRELASYE